MNSPAPDPRRDRQRRLIGFLRLATGAAFVMAVAGMLIPGEPGRVAGGLTIAILVAAPLLRVAWLARRWWWRGDRRFAAAAVTVLLVVAAGGLLA